MTIFLSLTRHTGVRVAEVGAALGALGGVIVMIGGMTPFGRRAGMVLGGLAVAGGFVLLVVAIRWGGFGAR
jgi:hypothetical protein